MEKIIIYTNENCSYCKTIKDKLKEENIEFNEKLTKDWVEEWQEISNLTGMPSVPTICYKDNYFVPSRDFGNAQGLINLLNNFKQSKFSESKQILERIKTLNINIIMAFSRLDKILKQIETKINKDEHESTN